MVVYWVVATVVMKVGEKAGLLGMTKVVWTVDSLVAEMAALTVAMRADLMAGLMDV